MRGRIRLVQLSAACGVAVFTALGAPGAASAMRRLLEDGIDWEREEVLR